MTTHECPRAGCARQVARSKLACPDHWALVSYPTKQLVYAAYRNRNRDLAGHFEAMAQAIDEMNR